VLDEGKKTGSSSLRVAPVDRCMFFELVDYRQCHHGRSHRETVRSEIEIGSRVGGDVT
jgi:hypothetical protein